jgi:hypothetical protein
VVSRFLLFFFGADSVLHELPVLDALSFDECLLRSLANRRCAHWVGALGLAWRTTFIAGAFLGGIFNILELRIKMVKVRFVTEEEREEHKVTLAEHS